MWQHRRLASPLGVRPSAAGSSRLGHSGSKQALASDAAADATADIGLEPSTGSLGSDTALAALHPALPWPDLQHALDLQVCLGNQFLDAHMCLLAYRVLYLRKASLQFVSRYPVNMCLQGAVRSFLLTTFGTHVCRDLLPCPGLRTQFMPVGLQMACCSGELSCASPHCGD